jgi:hypothetical protein
MISFLSKNGDPWEMVRSVFFGLEADKQHTIENWVLVSWGIIRLTTILLRGSLLTGRKIHLIQTHSIMTFVGIQRKCEHQWLHDWNPYWASCVRTFQGGNIIYSCGSKPDSSKWAVVDIQPSSGLGKHILAYGKSAIMTQCDRPRHYCRCSWPHSSWVWRVSS